MLSSDPDDGTGKPTGVAHFFAIDDSNSVVNCKLSRRDLTVSEDPAFESKLDMSSLLYGGQHEQKGLMRRIHAS